MGRLARVGAGARPRQGLRSTLGDPSPLSQSLPSCPDVVFGEHALSVSPFVRLLDRLIRCFGSLSSCHPMNSREELHSLRCFEAFDQLRHLVEAFQRLRVVCKETLGLFPTSGLELDLLAWPIFDLPHP